MNVILTMSLLTNYFPGCSMTNSAAMTFIFVSHAVLNIFYHIMSLPHLRLTKGILVSERGEEKILVLSEVRVECSARKRKQPSANTLCRSFASTQKSSFSSFSSNISIFGH